MSVLKLSRDLAGKAVGGAVHVVFHPVESAAYGAGLVRGAATAVRRLKAGEVADRGEVAGSGAGPGTGPASGSGAVTEGDLQGHSTDEPPTEPQRVGLAPGERLAAEREEAVGMPDPRPGQPGEQFETDPQASSRNSEHGGPGDDSDVDVLKDWPQDPGAVPDPGAPDVTTPVGTTGAGEGFNPDTGETDLQQPDTEPLMDPSLVKSVKSESDMMRKDADRDKSTDEID